MQPWPTDAPLVGRDSELRVIRNAIAAGSQVVVISGVGGIGKTRLAAEATATVADVRSVRCWDGDAAPGPWSTLLGIEESAGDDDRLRRFEDVLHRLAASPRSVLVIDDLHHADQSSILCARFLARRQHDVAATVVITTRLDDTVDDARRVLLTDLCRDARHVPLGPLDDRQVIELWRASGRSAHPDEAAAVVRLAQGSPLFVERLGAVEAAKRGAGSTLAEAVGLATNDLGDSDRRLMSGCVLLARDASQTMMQHVLDASADELHRVVRIGVQRGLLDARAAPQASHELIREAIEEWLPPSQRATLHLRLASTLMASHNDEQLITAATHACRAAELDLSHRIDAEGLGLLAIARLTAHGSSEAALDLHDRLQRLAVAAGVLGPASQRLAHARAALRAGRLRRSRQLFHEIATDEGGDADPATRALAAAGLGGIWLNEHRSDSEARAVRALQEHAERDVDAAHPAAALLRVRIAAEEAYRSSSGTAVLDALQAIEALDDPVALVDALSLAIHAHLGPHQADERARLVRRLAAAAARVNDPLASLLSDLWQAVTAELSGQPTARRARHMLRMRCETIDCAAITFVADAMDVGDLIAAGRFDEANDAAIRCFQLGAEVGDADAFTYLAGHLSTIRYLRGDVARDNGQPIGASGADASTDDFVTAIIAAVFDAHDGSLHAAGDVVRRFRCDGPDVVVPSSKLLALQGMAELALLLGDAALGADMVRHLAPLRAMPVCGSLAIVKLGSAERAYAMALAASGDDEAAERSYLAAEQQAADLGHRPVAVLCRAGRAQSAHRRGDPGALTLLMDAIESAGALGMVEWQQRWHALADAWRQHADQRAEVRVERRGEQWRCLVGDREVCRSTLVGFGHLAELCRQPGLEIPAVRLAYGIEPSESPIERIDPTTIDRWRSRSVELRSLIEHDASRRAVYEAELDAINEGMLAATALGGRRRRVPDAAERARTSVHKAIRRAIAVVTDADPAVGAHLSASVRSGVRCTYDPAISPMAAQRWARAAVTDDH